MVVVSTTENAYESFKAHLSELTSKVGAFQLHIAIVEVDILVE